MKDKNGKDIKRLSKEYTETGIILRSKDGKDWKISFPDGSKRYGGNTSHEKVAMFFLLLGMSHDLDYSKELAFHKTKLYGKYRKE